MLSEVVNIKPYHLNLIKAVLAHPVVDENIHLTDEEILQYCVSPALFKYFLKFPIQVPEQQFQNVTEMVFPFPDDDTIGLVDCRTVAKTGFGMKQGSNSDFWRVVRFNQEYKTMAYRSGKFQQGFNPNGLKYNFIAQQQMIDAMTNNLDTFRHEVNYAAKTVTVFSTVNAQILFVWAKTSNDFNMIKPTQILNVITLAKAELLRHLASLGRMMIDNGSEKQINVDGLESQADKIEQPVLDLWASIPDIVALRIS